MPQCETKYFGSLDYEDDSIVEFPAGLPGFETEKQFLLIDRPDLRPLAFLQSVATTALCFPTLPVLTVDADYQLELGETEQKTLGLPKRPAIGKEAGCFVIMNLRETGVMVNLLAPLVLNLKTRQAMQVIVADHGYSHEHPLAAFGNEAKSNMPLVN